MEHGKRLAGVSVDAPTSKRQSVEQGMKQGVEHEVEGDTAGSENTPAPTIDVKKAIERIRKTIRNNTSNAQVTPDALKISIKPTITIKMNVNNFRDAATQMIRATSIHFRVSQNTVCLALRLMDVWIKQVTWLPTSQDVKLPTCTWNIGNGKTTEIPQLDSSLCLSVMSFLMLACKHVEAFAFRITDILCLTWMRECERLDLANTELDTLVRLQWNVNIMTAMDWIDLILDDNTCRPNLKVCVDSSKQREDNFEHARLKCLQALCKYESSLHGDLCIAIESLKEVNVLTKQDAERMQALFVGQ